MSVTPKRQHWYRTYENEIDNWFWRLVEKVESERAADLVGRFARGKTGRQDAQPSLEK